MKFVAPKKGMTIFFTPLFCCCFWIRDPGSEIRDPRSGIRDPGSEIRDKHPGSATLGEANTLQPGKKIYKKNSRQKKSQDLLAGVLPPHVDVGVGVKQHVRLVGGGGAGGGLRSLVYSNPELPRTGHLGNNKHRPIETLIINTMSPQTISKTVLKAGVRIRTHMNPVATITGNLQFYHHK